ncbi:hypothetical protein PLESTM_001262400 [Pleodorina starrii]|nr:hypothetical protein PLESTM_001262400 [Pleodorina starrii]
MLRSGTAVYRLRIAGPDGLWLLEPTYCRPDFALAMYDLRHPGLFSVEVLMLYTSFSFVQPNSSRAVQSPWAGYLTLDVRAAPSPKSTSDAEFADVRLVGERWTSAPDESVLTNGNASSISWLGDPGKDGRSLQLPQHHRSRHPQPGGDASLPLCPATGPLPGRWHFAEWPPAAATTAAAAATLLRTCVWFTAALPDADCGGPERRSLRYDSHPAALSWRPYGCRMRAFAGIPPPPPPGGGVAVAAPPPAEPPPPPPPLPVTPASCLPPGRRVCFVGDSHTRYLQNSLVMWQRGFRASVNNTVKELLASDSVHYEYMRWGHDWPEAVAGAGDAAAADPLAAANCTDIVANFGQWPASYRSGSAPYSAVQYLRQLLRVRRGLLAARARAGVRVFWVTTVMSSLKARLESAGVDWRTDPLLTLYNRLALDVMSGGLPAALARMQSGAGAGMATEEAEVEAGPGWMSAGEGAAAAATAGAAGGGIGGVATAGSGVQAEQQQQQQPRRQRQRRRRTAAQVLRAAQEGQEALWLLAAAAAAKGSDGGSGCNGSGEGSSCSEDAGEGQRRVGGGGEAQQPRRARRRSRRLGQPRSDSQPQLQLQPRRDGGGVVALSSTSQGLLGWLQRALPSPWRGRRQLLQQLAADAATAPAATAAEATEATAAEATEATAAEAIPVIDTWSATRILHDATWDGVHYANTGAVGLVQLTAVLQALCSDEALEAAAAAAASARS